MNAKQIYALRRKLNLTQVQFAKVLGCKTQVTVSRWETDSHQPANYYREALRSLRIMSKDEKKVRAFVKRRLAA